MTRIGITNTLQQPCPGLFVWHLFVPVPAAPVPALTTAKEPKA